MAPSATMDQLLAEATQIGSQLEVEYPEIQRDRVFDVINLGYDVPSAQGRTLMALIQASVLSVLLIACVNITNLLLARGQERQREIALRTALGAGRGRIIRQLFTENSLIAVVGTAAGLGMGWYGIRILGSRFAPLFPASYVPVLDTNVLGFTIALSVLAGSLFGLAPAIQTFRKSQTNALKDGGGKSTAGGSRKRLSRVLVVGEIMLSLIALGGGGMLARSFRQLQNVEAGFDRSNLLTAQISIPASKYPGDEESLIFLNGIIEEAQNLSDVHSAALVSALPLGFTAPEDTFRIESGPVDIGENAPAALIVNSSPEYRETIDLMVLEGRFFTRTDRFDQPLVTVVSRTLAENFFQDRSAVGQRIHVRGESREIVGVVADVRQAMFQAPGAATPGVIYLPSGQAPRGAYALIARVGGDPRTTVEPLRVGLQHLDPDLALSQVLTLDEVVSQFFVTINAFNAILAGFGVMALLLAAVGVYGVLAHSVNRRRKEIGIRLALGARGSQVVRMFAGEGLRLGIIGLGIGLLSTLPISILLRSLFQGISTVEWNTVFVAGSVLFGVVLLASFVSASRATSVDPVKTLNIE
jgi:putative ABC transport system permease protein